MSNLSVKKSIQLYKRIWAYMSEYWQRFLISIVAMAVSAATEPAFARIMKPLIDKGFINQDRTAIILTPLLIAGIFLIRGVATFINEYNSTWLSGTIVEKMRNVMFNRLLRLPVQYYDDNNSGRILSRIVFDVTQITEAGFNIISVTFKDGLTIIGLLALLFYTNWQLTMFCVLTLPFVLVLVRVLAHRLRRLSQNNQMQYGTMTQIITESVQGQKVVKLFAGYDYELRRFSHSVNSIKSNNAKQAGTASLNTGLSQFLIACALAVILYFAAALAKTNHFTAGDFVSFITAMIMIMQPMKRITTVTQSLQKGLTAAESVFSFLDNPEETDNKKIQIDGVKSSIKFKNVTFKYPKSEKNVLDKVNIEIKVGETVALVGMSGSGKTTLANLLPRFYSPTSGEILIDQYNLQDISLTSLRDQIALVSQDVVLFNDTVYNNIAYGISSEPVSFEQVKEAATLANAIGFIEELPQGFETMIGENGTRLSGGQKQRLAISRAILKNASILILDEATSALDNQSEKLVQEALERLMHNRTTLVIAHRLSTVLHADKIVVMENGQVREIGPHAELLAKDGVYSKLYNVQLLWQASK